MPITRPKPRHVSHAPMGRVERESCGRGIGIVDVTGGAMQGPSRSATAHLPREYIHATLPHADRGLDGFHHARLLGAAHLHAVLPYLESRAFAPVHVAVALGLEEFGDFLLAEVLRHFDREGDHEARVTRRLRALVHLGEDGLGRIAANELTALAAIQARGAREEQFQMVVDLRHRADRRARRAHRIGLVDGDGGRNSLDGIHLRLVHAIEELARVGRESLDVAALSFRIQRVEYERGLARTRRARDDDELARGQRHVDIS